MQKLKNLASFKAGLHLSRVQQEKGHQYNVLKVSDLSPFGVLQYKDKEKIFSLDPIAEENLTQVGDVLIKLVAPCAVCITEKHRGFVFPSTIAAIRVDQSKILPEYLTCYLNSPTALGFFKKRVEGSSLSILKLNSLEELEIHIPSLEKQKKVAQFFQEAKQKITLLQEKLEAEIALHHAILENILR